MMKTEEILEKITQLKHMRIKLYSNCFIQFSAYMKRNWNARASQKSCFILNEDHGVNRIWFYTVDFQDLGILMRSSLKQEEEYVIDILAKDAELYKSDMEELGFGEFARMMRMSNGDVSSVIKNDSTLMKYYNPAIGIKATPNDAEEINQKLWKVFDSRISHLQTLDELMKSICREELYIQRTDEGNIGAILQRIAEPKSFYINQIYNGMEKEVIHSILLGELKKYCGNGGRYVYAWVEEKNKASVRFHKKYGLESDGLWNVIYIKRGI